MNFLIRLKDIKNSLFLRENIFYLLIIGVIFFLDRISKLSVLNNFNENKYFINDFINLDLIWNTGIGFGILSTNSSLFYNSISFLIALIIIILLLLALRSKTSDKIIFSLIAGGAIGNLYDRLVYNAVPDFIDLHYNNFHWFTFNIADIFISIGIIGFLFNGTLKN
tara:strand:- start:177 stop:674 length:498 start_codon:yes stop_codon:yes gene_type:complete